jgi:hypothetical protein
MFDPLTVGAGVVLWQLLKKSSGPGFGAMTPEREEMFNNALIHLQEPDKLIKLAQAFEHEGLKAQGRVLRRRAQWRGRDQKTRDEHEAIFQKALKSTNIPAILDVANAFEGMTATRKAKQLREHAESLKAKEAAVIDTTATVEKPAEKVVDSPAAAAS